MAERIYILTGPVQSGKTTRLMQWLAARKDVSGILTPIIDGRRIFLNAETKEQFRMEAEPGEENVFTIGRFVFSKNHFEKAIAILELAMKKNRDWLIIDEIGPLELKGKGFAGILHKILAGRNPFELIIVVRENLAEQVIDFFKIDKERAEILRTDSEFFNR